MATVSRGQVIEKNRFFEAMDLMSNSFDRLGKAMEEKRKLDLYEEQIKDAKWKMMHDALWQTIEADAKTNALGYRGALENFRDPLNAMYKLQGMTDEALGGMWAAFDKAPLSADALKRAAYAYYLQNGNFDNMTPLDAQEHLSKELEREAKLGLIEYPKVQSQEQTTQMAQGGPQGRPPLDLREQKLPSGEGEYPRGTALGRLQGVTRGLRAGESEEDFQRRIEREAIDRKVEPYKGEIPELDHGVPEGTGTLEQPPITGKVVYPGAAHPLKGPAIEVPTLKNVSREMSASEKLAYRQQMVKENKIPAPAAEALRSQGTQYQAAVDHFVQTGELPKPAEATIRQVGGQLKTAFQKPQYVSRLWERLNERNPQTGMNTLDTVIFNLGASQVGTQNPQATYAVGQNMLVGIFETDYMNAMTAARQVGLEEAKWKRMNRYFATIQLPEALGSGTRDLTFGEFISYMNWQTDMLNAQMKAAGGMGGIDIDATLKMVEARRKYEEPFAKQKPEAFRQSMNTLRATNFTYDWLVTTTDAIYNETRKGLTDAEGNPLPPLPGTAQQVTLPGPLDPYVGWINVFGFKPGMIGGKTVEAGETYARAFQETPKVTEEQKSEADKEAEAYKAERGF